MTNRNEMCHKDAKGILEYVNRMAKNNFKGMSKEGLMHLLTYGELLGKENINKIEKALK